MGFLFDDKKEEPKEQRPSQGFLATVGLMVLGFVLMLLTKLVNLFIELVGILARQALETLDPRGTENKTIQALKISIIVVLISVPLIFIYNIPSIRDALTLSSTHTINTQRIGHVLFPDRVYFVPEGERRVFQLEQNKSKKYVNYTGYKKNLFLPMTEGFCHLVTRNERVSLASAEIPPYALGFSNSVRYVVKESIGSLPPWRYFFEKIKNPEYFLQKREDLQVVFITYEKEEPWEVFILDFEKIPSIDENNKPYELKARYFEHAMVCY